MLFRSIGINPVQSLMGVAITERGDTTSEDSLFRLVVFGTSRWLMDRNTTEQNLALGLNLIDWLAQEDTLAAVRSKAVTTRDLLFSSGTHENISRWSNVAGVPLALVAIGLLRSVRRRRFGSVSYGQTGENRSRFGIRRRRKSSQEDGGDSK